MDEHYAGQLEVAKKGYAGIIDPKAYVNDRYHGHWTVKSEKRISGVPVLLQKAFSGARTIVRSPR